MLAERLGGMTVSELERRLTHREAKEWRAYYRLQAADRKGLAMEDALEATMDELRRR